MSRAGRSVATGEGTEFTCARTGECSRVSSSITRISMFPPEKGAARPRRPSRQYYPSTCVLLPAGKGKAYTNCECESRCQIERAQLSQREEGSESTGRAGDDVE